MLAASAAAAAYSPPPLSDAASADASAVAVPAGAPAADVAQASIYSPRRAAAPAGPRPFPVAIPIAIPTAAPGVATTSSPRTFDQAIPDSASAVSTPRIVVQPEGMQPRSPTLSSSSESSSSVASSASAQSGASASNSTRASHAQIHQAAYYPVYYFDPAAAQRLQSQPQQEQQQLNHLPFPNPGAVVAGAPAGAATAAVFDPSAFLLQPYALGAPGASPLPLASPQILLDPATGQHVLVASPGYAASLPLSSAASTTQSVASTPGSARVPISHFSPSGASP
ncbi:hypothetical protein HK405_009738, partial [Cladochytrium tenue]